MNTKLITTIRKGKRDGGFTLIEMIIAAAVLMIGVLAMAGLVGVAVSGNGRNRLDSSATMLAQAVVEQVNTGISYTSFGGTGTAFMTDCGTHDSANPWAVESGLGGAALSGGNIDFSQPKIAGYQMDYVICNGSIQTTYDVRWNISALATTATTTYTHILTVGVQMKNGGLHTINFPVNLKVMVGPDPAPGT